MQIRPLIRALSVLIAVTLITIATPLPTHAQVGPALAPSEPTNVQATDGTYSHKVKITWSASAGATRYELWRAQTWGSASWMHSATTTYTYDTVPTHGVTYWYLVKACNATSCSGMINSYDQGFAHYPAVPQNVQATDGAYSDRVRITWDAADYALVYRVYRGTDLFGSYDTVLSEDVTATYFDDTTAELNEDYYYWVRACNMDDCSNLSDRDGGNRLAPPSAVWASDGTYTDRVYVNWPSITGATYYKLYRGISTAGYNTTWDNIVPSEYDDYTANAGTTYYYWVKSCNSNGCSSFSQYDEGNRATATSTPTRTATRTATSPAATRTPTSTRQSVATRTPTPTNTSRPVATRTPTQTRLPTRTPTATRTDPTRTATPTATASPTVTNTSTPTLWPAAPEGVQASDGTFDDRVRVTWKPRSNATSYRVFRSATANSIGMTLATLTGLGSTTDTTFDDHTAVAGVVYYYSVRACNSHGCSEDSLQNPGYARTGDVMRLFLPAIMR